MAHKDDRLQELLEDLENEAPTRNAGEDRLEDQELVGLVLLADAIRQVESPQMRSQVARGQKEAYLKLARAARQPDAPQPTFLERLGLFPVLAGGLAMAVIVFLCIGTLLMGTTIFGINLRGNRAALTDINGLVEISQGDGVWQAVSEDTSVTAGQAVRTGPASSARLNFFEGSTSFLEPNTEVALSELSGRLGSLRVSLVQSAGESSHRVVPLRGPGSAFQVVTPSGEARVHGTTFQVAVGDQGASRISVSSGQVSVQAEGQEVILDSGQATTVQLGQVPAPAAFQFRGRGPVSEISGTTWVVGGVPVTVIDQTMISGDPHEGDHVRVVGRILDGSLWLADKIDESDPGGSRFQFSGILTDMDGPIWTINEDQVVVDEATDLDENLETEDLVLASFSVQENGDWLASKIEKLDDSPEEPTPTPTATPDPLAQPSLSFEPDELAARGCTPRFDFVGTLVNTGDPPDDYAANVVLGFVILRGAEYVQRVEIDPQSWDQIAGGEVVNFTVRVGLKEAWLQAPDGSEVKLRLFIAGETNRPGHHRTRLTLTMIAQCDLTPTPTPDMTPTMTLTPTHTLTPTLTPTATFTPQVTPPDQDDKVTLCHRPPGNPENAHTITVGRSAVPAHLAHGDTLGPCPGDKKK